MVTSAADLIAQQTKSGQTVKKLVESTPYIPPASVSVPASSNVQAPPIPQGGQTPTGGS